MPKEISAPDWFPLKVYSKKHTPKEWIVSLYKRILYKKAVLLHPNKSKTDLFNFFILGNEEPDVLETLRQIEFEKNLKPIQPPSIFDTLFLATKITRSPWFNGQEDKVILEEMLLALDQGKRLAELSQQQMEVYERYQRLPWFAYDDTILKNGYPKIKYISSEPMMVNAGFSRQDIVSDMRNIVTRLKKGTPWQLSPEILDSWTRKNILAVFDLTEWFKVNNLKISKIKLAQMIWPNPPPSLAIEDSAVHLKELLEEGIKLAAKVIQGPIISTLWLYSKTQK